MLVPELLAGAFTDYDELISYTARALRIYMSASLIFGGTDSLSADVCCHRERKTSLFLAVLRKLILLIPLIYILPAIIEDKETAVYLAEPVADVIAVLTTATMFAVGFGKSMKSLKKTMQNNKKTAFAL